MLFLIDENERKKLVKTETYYETQSINKLWRYVLRVIIEYISLDTRFARVRTHHFVLLNHFRHGIKISFPFSLFTSMSKSIEGLTNKLTANPTLHEGFLLLVYEYLKTQTRGKSLGEAGNVFLRKLRAQILRKFRAYIQKMRKLPPLKVRNLRGENLFLYQYCSQQKKPQRFNS